MNREEVLALGVPEEKYKEFQYLYNRDLEKAANRKCQTDEEGGQTRSAIHAMLKLIKRPETLDSILKYINRSYYGEA